MTIEFGVVDHLDKQKVPAHETYESRLKLVELYDRLGFSTFHLTEHHFTPLGLAPSPIVFLAAASQVGKRIRFAPLILIATLYHPLRLAGEICMIDQITKGRFEIGTGRGISPYELAYFNVSHLEAPAIYQEAMDVLMMALTQDIVDFRGHYFKFFNVPIELHPFQKPHPPLWHATGNPDNAEWAGSKGMNICFHHPAPQARILIDRYKAGWNKAFGPGHLMPKVGLTRHIYVADTDAEARERGTFGYLGWYEKFAYLWKKNDPRPPMGDPASLAPRAVIMGSPATVRAELEALIEQTGMNYFVTRFAYGDLSHEESVRSTELFAREVMPHFQKARGAA
jgi:alkanesulfonate monooxygenase SsuD/methylene tetrahydromethanopterin reductase-like flavin-dependent oxidoreductase (luciferase family)